MTTNSRTQEIRFSDPPVAISLFASPKWSWLWLIARVYLGYTWVTSGLGKLSNPGWVETGEALKGFWEQAVAVPEPPARPAITFDWYRAFIQSLLDSGAYTWFSKVIVAGEIIIGIALILGIFTGIAAFAGGFMNWNFMMAGTASINPLLFTISIFLILAWKNAGWLGIDRWLLPTLGTPWQPGRVFKPEPRTE